MDAPSKEGKLPPQSLCNPMYGDMPKKKKGGVYFSCQRAIIWKKSVIPLKALTPWRRLTSLRVHLSPELGLLPWGGPLNLPESLQPLFIPLCLTPSFFTSNGLSEFLCPWHLQGPSYLRNCPGAELKEQASGSALKWTHWWSFPRGVPECDRSPYPPPPVPIYVPRLDLNVAVLKGRAWRK
jgi:hypothetical protein